MNSALRPFIFNQAGKNSSLNLKQIMSSLSTRSNDQKFKVYVSQAIPKQAQEILESNNIELVINQSTAPLSRENFLSSIKNVDAIFCTLNEKINREALDAAGPRLKVIGTCSVGYDHIDVNECSKRNIPLGFTPGVLTEATAELAIGLLLNTSRRVSESINSAKAGEWSDWKIMWMCGKGLHGSNVGIFGLGRIGMAIAKRLVNFGTNKIMYTNRKPSEEASRLGYEFVESDVLLNKSDFLVCACAANKETERYFDLAKFKKMKRDAIFINISRGSVVNQEDLVVALKENLISAAGLDVTSPEPLPLDHELFKLKNCIITPHIGSAENSTRIKMATITANNIVNGLNNKPLIHQIRA